tara:strand:- start:4413 stop:5180 length:768 start_codon:yes stop_codon:yes gene_type:complete
MRRLATKPGCRFLLKDEVILGLMLEHYKIDRTAILIFANSSKEEMKYKAIPKGNILFDVLTEHTLNTARKTGLPYFLMSEKEQIGSSFGERFVNAISSIFELDFDMVITIGNDTPQLKSSDIVRASKLLGAKKSVLGPSRDGGFYLMGIHKSQFDAKTFRELPWKTNALAKKITTVIEASKVHVIQFRILLDLDTHADLKSILKGLKDSAEKIFQIIIYLVTPNIKVLFLEHLQFSLKFYRIYFNKGSPFPIIYR